MPAERAIAPFAGCTIVLRSAVPHALVLASSFRKFHPKSEFFILVLDGLPNAGENPRGVRFLYLGDLELNPGDEWRLPMLHTATELASIFRPAFLRRLLKSGIALAAYFESSTKIFAPLGDMIALTARENIVLKDTASTDPEIDAGDVWGADKSNSGKRFIAVSRSADEFLREWFDRLAKAGDWVSDTRSPARDSKSLVDSYPHHAMIDPAFDVGYWNLHPATFAWKEDHYEVEGKPLRSFNFRGYDPDKPHLLSKYQGVEPRILLSQHPAVAKICDDYREQLIRAGHDKLKSTPYRFGSLENGLPIDHRMRRLYREALTKFNQGLDREPPSPFGPEGEKGFLKWLNEPVEGARGVTRYMLAILDEREDVRNAFPDPLGVDADGLRDWYLHFGRCELNLPDALIPQDVASHPVAETSYAVSASVTPAVNVAGYFHAELGIGAAARSLLAALEAAGIPFNTISFDATANRQDHPFAERVAGMAADLNIVCVNPDQLSLFAERTGPELRQGRYTIGVWFWEVEDFPQSFHGAFNYVDEVWVASAFMRETFLKVSPKPVFKFHLPILKPQIDPSLSRATWGLPNQFLFFFSFDFFSVLARKNPLGLIQAFTSAFAPNEGPVLMIKTINGDKRIPEMEKLRYATRFRPDIVLSDGYLPSVENSALMAQADCYVSLHRSEGFGLTIAEAMALGKPTIATGYSGNLEFMTSENSYLCPCERCEVGPEREPYPATSHWSEPDIEAAARLLRHVYIQRDEAREKGLRAAEDIRALHSTNEAGSIIRDRIATIRQRRMKGWSNRSTALLEDRLEELEKENARLRSKIARDA